MVETEKFITLDHPAFQLDNKTALVFPGQGMQRVGMGSELYTYSPRARSVYDLADQTAAGFGKSIKTLSFTGPADALKDTGNTQLAILTYNQAHYETMQEELGENFRPSVVAGFSLGEYSAMCVAKVISFEEMVKVVHLRGKAMQQVIEENPGGKMIITIRNKGGQEITPKQQRAYAFVIRRLREEGLEIGSVISPTQMGLGGSEDALQNAIQWVRGLRKEPGYEAIVGVRMSGVAGPYHTSGMKDAVLPLEKALDETSLLNPVIPLASNVKGDIINTAGAVKTELLKHLTHKIMWHQIVRMLGKRGARYVVEPGNKPAVLPMWPEEDRVILPVRGSHGDGIVLAHILMPREEADAA